MPIVGLELGRHKFRAIEIDKKKDEYIVNNFGHYENPKLNLESESPDDVNLYANTLKDFFSEIGFSTPYVVVGLDETYVYMRTVKFPDMSDKDLKNAVNFEAEQYIPLPLADVNLGYERMDADYNEKGKVNVQLVAAKKSIINRYVQIIKKAGLTPKAIEPETIALGRALGDKKESPSGSLILDIGFSRTLIIIVYGGYVRFTRSTQVGGDVITKTIQQSLNLEYGQSEEYKKVYGMEKSHVDGKIYEVVKPILDNVINEVKRAIIFFTKENQSANIRRVILTGGTAQMPGILPYMASNLDVEVETANPFKTVQVSPRLEKKKATLFDEAPIFAAPYGLALREI